MNELAIKVSAGVVAIAMALLAAGACSTGSVDTSGSDSGCPGNLTECGDDCADTAWDPANCGTCGNACPAGQVCNVGTCSTECSGGSTKCGDNCVDVKWDPTNCGSCGNTCLSSQVCNNSSCGSQCGGGTSQCGGACVDTNVDPSHCGGCGLTCSPGEVCSTGTCQLSCGGGTSECNGMCVNTQLDPANCGGCGSACPSGLLCTAGSCALQCSGGTNSCNGLCVDTSVDPLNCGGCGNTCGNGQVCTSGSCATQCGPGTVQCGAICTNTSNDPANCGACNVSCGLSEACVNGGCVSIATGGPCQNGATELSVSPSGSSKVCDDPTDVTCEQDFESLCPLGWHLCSRLEHNNRNNGWNFTVGSGASAVLGEIYCRSGGGAGHFTLGPYDNITNLGTDAPLNCGFGSSRPNSCPATYGCNETTARALCCAPSSSCGNGVVDNVEEECDDANNIETDACLNNCTWRVPAQQGLSGLACN